MKPSVMRSSRFERAIAVRGVPWQRVRRMLDEKRAALGWWPLCPAELAGLSVWDMGRMMDVADAEAKKTGADRGLFAGVGT